MLTRVGPHMIKWVRNARESTRLRRSQLSAVNENDLLREREEEDEEGDEEGDEDDDDERPQLARARSGTVRLSNATAEALAAGSDDDGR